MSAEEERSDEIVGWIRVDGYPIPLSEDDAWKIAWGLIGMCVDHKQAVREKEAASAGEDKP